jgi:hypothetical protein
VKYGAQQAQLMLDAQIRGINKAQHAVATQESPGEITADTGLSVLGGAAGTVGSLAQVAALPFGSTVNNAIADATRATTGGINSLKSETRLRRDAMIAERSALIDRDEEHTRLAEGDTGLMGMLRREGRSAIRKADLTLSDTGALANLVGQGVGSVGGGGLIAKGTAKVLGGAKKVDAALEGIISKEALHIGLSEGGGIIQQANQAVADIPLETLQKTPEFQAYAAANPSLTPAEVKEALRHEAGKGAALPGIVAGVATSKLADKFVKSPFKAKGIGEIAENTTRETTEEALIGGVGRAISNDAVRRNADGSADTFEGVGGDAALGAMGGFGTAGTMQSASLPKIAANGVKNAVTGAVDKLTGAVAEHRETQAATAKTAAQAAQREAAQQVQTKVTTATAPAATDTPEVAKEKTAVAATAQDAIDALSFPKGQLPVPASDSAKAETAEAETTLDAIITLMEGVRKREGATDPKTVQEIVDFTAAIGGLVSLGEETKTRLGTTKTGTLDPGLAQILASVEEHHNNVFSDAKVAEIRQAALDILHSVPHQAIDRDTLDTPEGQANASVLAAKSVSSPEDVSHDDITSLLEADDEGDFRLTPAQRKALEMEARMRARFSKKQLTDTRKAETADPEKAGKLNWWNVAEHIASTYGHVAGQQSVRGYFTEIHKALTARKPDIAAAKLSLHNLSEFSQHLQNKVEALEKSKQIFLATGKVQAVSYNALQPKSRKWKPAKTGMTYSAAFEKQLRAEAAFVQGARDTLAEFVPGSRRAPKAAPTPTPAVAPTTTPTTTKGAPTEQGELFGAEEATAPAPKKESKPAEKASDPTPEPEQTAPAEEAETITVAGLGEDAEFDAEFAEEQEPEAAEKVAVTENEVSDDPNRLVTHTVTTPEGEITVKTSRAELLKTLEKEEQALQKLREEQQQLREEQRILEALKRCLLG